MNPSFVKYLIPNINMMPRIETTSVHGYPGAGEIASVLPMVATKSQQDDGKKLVDLGKSDTQPTPNRLPRLDLSFLLRYCIPPGSVH